MARIKITSGIYKGRNIESPDSEQTHPMGSREKIALFNMLNDYLPNAQVLDAYAGSGALGIEALSRGAAEVLFVDESHVAMRTIVMNCMSLGIEEEQVAFYRGSVSAFYKKFVCGQGTSLDPRMAVAMETFPEEVDVIIADPPYDDFNEKEVSRLANDYLKPEGVLALSHPGEAPEFPGLILEKSHQYAGATISIYTREN